MHDRRRRGFVSTLYDGLDATRRFLFNLLFLAVVVGIVVLLLRSGKPAVPKKAALVLAPRGTIVEQLSVKSPTDALRGAAGSSEPQTLMKDVVDAIDAARDDDRIQVLYLDLRQMGGAGMSKLQTLGAAIDGFRATGKRVVASADGYDQYSYYLASHADEVWLNNQGMVLIEGFGRYKTYYKDLIDRLEIDWNVFRVGEYKSAVEPYLRNGISPEAKEADLAYLSDLWNAWLDDVSSARTIERADLVGYVDGYPDRLETAGGDGAKAALEATLVDHVAPRDAVRDRLIELVGEDSDTRTFHQIAFGDYLETRDDRFGENAKGDLVAVVVAKGTILDGSQPPGKIGGDSTAALIRKARNDDQVKAVVLRVDSGGGSASASEVIRRELELTRAAGKPVVSSMGSVAASGGYWITMASDEVIAAPTTITGSIGIFGMFPTYQKPLAKYLGIHVDGVGTTRFSGALRPDRALDPEVARTIQLFIDQGYREFITKAAAARHTTPEAIDAIARGRVWSGRDALEIGLVDSLGGLDDAIAAAARLANLGDDYHVRYIQKERDWKQQLVADLLEAAIRIDGTGGLPPGGRTPLARMVRSLEHELETLTDLNDPHGIYAWFPYEGP